jgi:hypothetical protein
MPSLCVVLRSVAPALVPAALQLCRTRRTIGHRPSKFSEFEATKTLKLKEALVIQSLELSKFASASNPVLYLGTLGVVRRRRALKIVQLPERAREHQNRPVRKVALIPNTTANSFYKVLYDRKIALQSFPKFT